jgi:hypothetical protein
MDEQCVDSYDFIKGRDSLLEEISKVDTPNELAFDLGERDGVQFKLYATRPARGVDPVISARVDAPLTSSVAENASVGGRRHSKPVSEGGWPQASS